MKKLYLFLLLCGFALPVFSQVPGVQVDRRIYLWDVTLSMQGYQGATPDIWDDVVRWISDDIKEISDENTELVVLPFQKHILADWHARADRAGKAELLRHIADAKKMFRDTTTTNIADPFRVVMNNYVDKKRNNIVFLLTDGKQSPIHGGQAAWLNLLDKWHLFAKNNNAFLVYLMLTPDADDNRVSEILNPDTGISVPPDMANIKIISIEPQRERVELNVSSDVEKCEIRIPFANNKAGLKFPENVRISVKSAENSLISFDEDTVIINRILNIPLGYSAKELKDLMDAEEVISVPLTLELLNHGDILKDEQINLILTRNEVELVLINQIQKKLSITLKK